MTTKHFVKVLSVIESCTTTDHIECCDKWLQNISASPCLFSALQWRRVEVAANAAINVSDKISEAQERLNDATTAFNSLALDEPIEVFKRWAIVVQNCQKELTYWSNYFEAVE